jgi:arabinose-5-phosphate isomerase
MDSKDIIKIGQEVVEIEYQAIRKIYKRINNSFAESVKLILHCNSRLIIVGIGKSAIIAKKLVATFNSTGQPAIFLHAAEAIHGDLGSIQKKDVVLCISKSGNTSEIKQVIGYIKEMKNKIISLSGNPKSYLAKQADIFLDASVEKEACPYNLAPTSSTTVQLVIGDALAVSLLKCRDFSEEDFARFHPGGILGKRLTVKVKDFISDVSPKVKPESLISDVIIEISRARLGATAVIENNLLVGIITDGDLRRMLELNQQIESVCAKDIMSENPKVIDIYALAYSALKKMEKNNITQLIVKNKEKYVGIVHIHDIVKEGIVE